MILVIASVQQWPLGIQLRKKINKIKKTPMENLLKLKHYKMTRKMMLLLFKLMVPNQLNLKILEVYRKHMTLIMI